ncbi:ABC transporter permease [Lichenihabitans sp. Uapishka_5]|uniref:ABC transporter permease n=1 Tax=Lichenihabitans sp. Uapishka_5 TaxID=3037302 RepID=UPI0029E7D8F3|nr:ABC transporter permease [Lichenihabitans sp. Uapishka_5]MDX7950572.1 ABC transporter permease [Lichenihabitans sp. Uapishka_5]
MTVSRRGADWRFRFAAQRTTLSALIVFVVIFALYGLNHESGFSPNVLQTAANKGVLLALVAVAQTFVVLTGGIDLSVGATFILADCLASTIVLGSPLMTGLGIAGVLAAGLACGLANGLLVVYGRLQPIVATIATGAIYFGFALLLRPNPGGDVNADLADAVTGQLTGGIPTSTVVLAAIMLLVWVPFRRSFWGRAVYAVGSSEPSAYMSGLPIGSAKLLAYGLAGLFSALGGLMLAFITYSGEASSSNAATYTLNSIAAVVIGGVSLFGGSGSAIGAIFGAFIFRTINDLLFVFNLDPLWQPLFLGFVLLGAVSLGAVRLLRLRNRLDLFDR